MDNPNQATVSKGFAENPRVNLDRQSESLIQNLEKRDPLSHLLALFESCVIASDQRQEI